MLLSLIPKMFYAIYIYGAERQNDIAKTFRYTMNNNNGYPHLILIKDVISTSHFD